MPQKIIKFIGIKSQNKKICIVFLLAIFCATCLTACQYKRNPADIIVEYQIPFAESANHLNEIKLIDKDDFGRKLYSYESAIRYGVVFRDFIEVDDLNTSAQMYIVAQKVDGKFVYCYDNFCFVYVKSFEIDNSDIISELKEKNDWNKPIQVEKLTALSTDVGGKKLVGYPIYNVEESAVSTLEKFVGYQIDDYFLDAISLPDATPIFVLREVESWEEITFGKSYVFSLPTEAREASYLELSDNIQNWNEEIHNFKMTLLADK